MATVSAIISARRAYEFQTDEIRLTTVSHHQVLQSLRVAFEFADAELATPPQVFGPVPLTSPPGLVFAGGLVPGVENSLVTIRLLAVDSSRIVIDLAAPSEFLDVTYNRLVEELSEFRGPDDKHPVGTPVRTLDYSEIVFCSHGLLERMVSLPASEVISRYRPGDAMPLVPSIAFGNAQNAADYREVPYFQRFSIEPRIGTSPESGLVFSAAPLDSTRHMEMMEDLETSLLRAVG